MGRALIEDTAKPSGARETFDRDPGPPCQPAYRQPSVQSKSASLHFRSLPRRCDLTSEPEELNLVKSFLVAPSGSQSPEEVKAMADFFQLYEPIVRSLVKNCASCPEDAKDIFQEVWAALIAKLPTLDYDPKRGPLRAWVIVVARHAALRAARRLRRNRADALTPELAEALVDPGPDPITQLEREQEREWVRSILATASAKLSEPSRRIMELHWIDGRSVPEIAAALHFSKDRVRMTLLRVLKKLRDRPGDSKIQEPQK